MFFFIKSDVCGQGQVVIQTIPTMVPATAENGDKITVQLAKIITIPAHQLAQCQLQTSTATSKSNVRAPPAGLGVLGSPVTVRALTPVNVSPGTQVMRLSVPSQTQQQTVVAPQPSSGPGGPPASSAGQAVVAQPWVISGVINGSELVIGGAAADKLKASGVHVHAVQVPVQQMGSKRLQNIQTEPIDAEVVIKVEAPDTMKTEEPPEY